MTNTAFSGAMIHRSNIERIMMTKSKTVMQVSDKQAQRRSHLTADQVFRNRFRELCAWFSSEKGMDQKDLCEHYRKRRDKLLPELRGQLLMPAKFNSHSLIALWAGDNGVHRRISAANAKIVFDDPFVTEFNKGKSAEDKFTRENYERDTPPSTQISNRDRRELKGKAVRKRAPIKVKR